jgi:hypothetical protein
MSSAFACAAIERSAFSSSGAALCSERSRLVSATTSAAITNAGRSEAERCATRLRANTPSVVKTTVKKKISHGLRKRYGRYVF